MGVPPGGAGFVRGNVELLGLHGARCVDCGTINTPPSVHPACIGCGGTKLEAQALARSGTVQTFVVNHTMPAPFVAPLPLAVVDLDDGARIQLQGLPEDAETLRIGDRVELELRRYAVERGVPVYGFKVRRTEGIK
jgi:hydroxymethylglutaryl-CoA synthase